MAEGKQLLPGFNHNVRHAGKLFHVQTEDSGAGNPHVTTHLFLGGNVLASKRTSYEDDLGRSDLAQHVRKLMEAQHKDMLRQVVRGAFDEPATARAYAPGELAEDAQPAAAAPPAPEPPPPAPPARPPRAPAVDGWGPPVLPRANRAPPRPLAVAAPPPAKQDRRLDDLILSYLAEDLGSKRER
jgi:hypothetical protein